MPCPGPVRTGENIWECDGWACDQKGMPDTCRSTIEKRGYTFRLTPKGQTAEREHAKQRGTSNE